MEEQENVDDKQSCKNQDSLADEASGLQPTIEEKRAQFGSLLKSKRLEIAYSKRDVVHLTRISPPFLDALENGDFDALPGAVFGRGFVKNICKAMEVDSAGLLIAYDQCWDDIPAKVKNYSYNGRLISGKRKKDYKNKARIPFSNYLSPKGLLLWLGGPPTLALIVAVSFKTWRKIGHEPSSSGDTLTVSSADIQEKPVKDSEDEQKSSLLKTEAHSTITPDNPAAPDSGRPENVADAPLGQSHPDLPHVPDGDNQSQPPRETVTILAPQLQADGARATEHTKLLLRVNESVSFRYSLDEERSKEQIYEPGLYEFGFKNKIDIYCQDTSKIEITFNGRPLGDFGIHRNSKQLSFLAEKNKPHQQTL